MIYQDNTSFRPFMGKEVFLVLQISIMWILTNKYQARKEQCSELIDDTKMAPSTGQAE